MWRSALLALATYTQAQNLEKCTLQNPANGDVTCHQAFGIKMCEISCHKGYTRDDSSIFACAVENDQAKWSPQIEGAAFPGCYKIDDQCQDLSAPENGYVHCETDPDSGDRLCWPECSQGFMHEDRIPLRGYYRCSVKNGEGWKPINRIPKCIPMPVDVNNQMGIADGILDRAEAMPLDQQGYCMTWGEHHYRTFDGRMYRFNGKCSYILATDEQTFSVTLHNDPSCDGSKDCKRTLSVSYSHYVLNLSHNSETGMPSAVYNGQELSLPTSLGLMSIKKASNYIIVRVAVNNMMIKWDGAEDIFIQVDDEMHGKLRGLCGDFDHDKSNDFHNLAGGLDTSASVDAFANSWAAPGDDECMPAHSTNFCTTDTETDIRKASQAVIECSYIMETECKYVVDPTPFFEACREDVCFGSEARENKSFCNAMAAYFRECARHGVSVEWRSESRCPASCPAGLVYRNCGSSSPATCEIQNPIVDDKDCIDGCHCPEGKVLHDGQCITASECPCMYGGDLFETKARIKKDCNQCVCFSGKWHCTKNKCDGVCSVASVGYTTFDGMTYSFQSTCKYTLLVEKSETPDYEVMINNQDCSGNECSRSLVIRAFEHSIKLLAGGSIVINDGQDSIIPWSDDGLSVERVNSEFVKVTLPNDLTIMFNGHDRIIVRSPATLYGMHHGLCGVFDGRQNNDFETPEGVCENEMTEFVKSWADETCEEAPAPSTNNACKIYPENADRASELCGAIMSNDFLKCHKEVDKNIYYENCRSEFCKSGNEEVVCNILSSYAMECATAGINMDSWRENTQLCQVSCPAGQVWKECGSICRQSCATVSKDLECVDQCVAGCQCADGMVRDHANKCIPAEECRCEFNGHFYANGEHRYFDCNVCECHKGGWFCTDNACEHNESCEANQMFSQCMDMVPLTCSNMHLPKHKRMLGTHKSHCQPGCICVAGTVFDEISKSCVEPSSCPCHYGGRSYTNGEKLVRECEDCTCVNSNWECNEKACKGQCRAYGDSHYTTFDGQDFRFQGACDYILARAKDSSWRVTIRNEKCGSTGTVCAKSVKFSVDFDDASTLQEINLITGKPIHSVKGSDKFSVNIVGRWVFVRAKNVELRWDKGTTVIVRVDKEYQDQLEGLCGNYNGATNDDFMKQDGITVGSVLEFGDSWRSSPDCEDAIQVVSPCTQNPQREPWAIATCGQLIDTEGEFAACHQFVSPQKYFDNCVFDACACDSGNDCACLCTAMAVYVEECNKFGVHINWRHQKLCPMQCDGCAGYSPCISACPKTCGHNSGDDEECLDGCVEGCTCEKGFVLSNDMKTCIPEVDCECTNIDGVSYGEGAKIESLSSACEACYCMNKEVKCVSLDCSPNETPDETPIETPETPDETPDTTPVCEEPVCLLKCDSVCHAWSNNYSTSCSADKDCLELCADEAVECPEGYIHQDATTCVRPDDCSCQLPNDLGVLVAGRTYNDYPNCQRYLCLGNELIGPTPIPDCHACNCIDETECNREYGEIWCPADSCSISECIYDMETKTCSIQKFNIAEEDLTCDEGCVLQQDCDDCCCYNKKCVCETPSSPSSPDTPTPEICELGWCQCAQGKHSYDIGHKWSGEKGSCMTYACGCNNEGECVIDEKLIVPCDDKVCFCENEEDQHYHGTEWYSADKCEKYRCRCEGLEAYVIDVIQGKDELCPPPCNSCEWNGQTLEIGQTVQNEKDLCLSHICEKSGNKCNVRDVVETCPKPPKAEKGLFAEATPVEGVCCPTYELTPCRDCDKTEMAVSCPKIEQPKCDQCQEPTVACLAAGSECCCPAEYECIQCPCSIPEIISCSPCQKVVEKKNECGCSVFECEAVEDQIPVCDKCCELVTLEAADEHGCPMYECSCPNQECPEGTVLKTTQNKDDLECPHYSCCTACANCRDNDLNIRELDEVFCYDQDSKHFDACRSFICNPTTCQVEEYKVTDPKADCPAKPELNGEEDSGFFYKLEKADDQCCGTWKRTPCECCDEKKAGLNCPKPEPLECGKCELKSVTGLMDGTECCCPLEYQCVPRACPAIKVTSCRPCEFAVETVDECGCKNVICKPRPQPTCDKCCKLMCVGVDKETKCPQFECQCPDVCPDTHDTIIEKDGMCPTYSCCEKPKCTECLSSIGEKIALGATYTEQDFPCATFTCQRDENDVCAGISDNVECPCESCLTSEGLPVTLGATWKEAAQPCLEYTCIRNEAEQCVGMPKEEKCQEPGKADKGKFWETIEAAPGQCCPTYQQIPCVPATEAQKEKYCEAPKAAQCGKCQEATVGCLKTVMTDEGAGICCVAEYQCVSCPCAVVETPSCGCHEYIAYEENECGCPTLTCKPKGEVMCADKCCTLKVVDEASCSYECECPDKEHVCAEAEYQLTPITGEDASCPSYRCCRGPTPSSGPESPTCKCTLPDKTHLQPGTEKLSKDQCTRWTCQAIENDTETYSDDCVLSTDNSLCECDCGVHDDILRTQGDIWTNDCITYECIFSETNVCTIKKSGESCPTECTCTHNDVEHVAGAQWNHSEKDCLSFECVRTELDKNNDECNVVPTDNCPCTCLVEGVEHALGYSWTSDVCFTHTCVATDDSCNIETENLCCTCPEGQDHGDIWTDQYDACLQHECVRSENNECSVIATQLSGCDDCTHCFDNNYCEHSVGESWTHEHNQCIKLSCHREADKCTIIPSNIIPCGGDDTPTPGSPGEECTSCLHNDVHYELGTSWADSENACTQMSCNKEDELCVARPSHCENCDEDCDSSTCHCEFDAQIYQKSATWLSGDSCMHYECLENVETEECYIQETPQDCGSSPGSPGGEDCDCLYSGIKYAIGASWTSEDDICTQMTCEDQNGMCVAVPTACANCSEEDCDPSSSCHCEFAGKIYQKWTSWPSEDWCVNYECVEGEYENQCLVKPTEQECSCYCEFEGQQYVPLQQWNHADKDCITYTCPEECGEVQISNNCECLCSSEEHGLKPVGDSWNSGCVHYSCIRTEGTDDQCHIDTDNRCCQCDHTIAPFKFDHGAKWNDLANNCLSYECIRNEDNICNVHEIHSEDDCTPPPCNECVSDFGTFAIGETHNSSDAGCNRTYQCEQVSADHCPLTLIEEICECKCNSEVHGVRNPSDTWTDAEDKCKTWTCNRNSETNECTEVSAEDPNCDVCYCEHKGVQYAEGANWVEGCRKFLCTTLVGSDICGKTFSDENCCTCTNPFDGSVMAEYDTFVVNAAKTCEKAICSINKETNECTVSQESSCCVACDNGVAVGDSWNHESSSCISYKCETDASGEKCLEIENNLCCNQCADGMKFNEEITDPEDKCYFLRCENNVEDNCPITRHQYPCKTTELPTCDSTSEYLTRKEPCNECCDADCYSCTPCKVCEAGSEEDTCPEIECPDYDSVCELLEPARMETHGECCCIAEWKKIVKQCPEITKTPVCKACETLEQVNDQCGCPSLRCVMRTDTPICEEECWELVNMESKDEEGCPAYQCRQQDSCPKKGYKTVDLPTIMLADTECPQFECCSQPEFCYYNEQQYTVGQTFTSVEDVCQVLTCNKDCEIVPHEIINCPEMPKGKFVKIEAKEGECCPTWEEIKFCLYEGVEYQPSETFLKKGDACTTLRCSFECKVEEESVESCPPKPSLEKGEFLKEIAPEEGKCCPTYQVLPCECCTEKEAALECPAALSDPKCSKCEIKRIKSLMTGEESGTECCCPAEFDCVARACPAIKVTTCRPCEFAVETVDECGCKNVICKARPDPVCDPCCTLSCDRGFDKETGCPLFDCMCPDTCAEGQEAKQVSAGKNDTCPVYECCDKQCKLADGQVVKGKMPLDKWSENNGCSECSCDENYVVTCTETTCNECPKPLVALDKTKNVCCAECGCAIEVEGQKLPMIKKLGEQYTKDECTTCECTENGEVCTTPEKCSYTCSGEDIINWKTFDGLEYIANNFCEHILSDIQLESGAMYKIGICRGAKQVNFMTIFTHDNPFYTYRITRNHMVEYGENSEIIGKKTALENTDISLNRLNDGTIKMTLANDMVTILFNPTTNHWSITADHSLKEKTQGICGTINDNSEDDSVNFDDYKVESDHCDCIPDCPEGETCEPCEFEECHHNMELQGKGCELLRHQAFAPCHDDVDVEKFIQNCQAKTVAPYFQCDFCSIAASYAQKCKTAGICLNYKEVTCCGKDTAVCVAEQQYQACGPCIKKSCVNKDGYDASLAKGAIEMTCEGCYCPEGMVEHKGACIDPKECPCCVEGDKNYLPGDSWRSAKNGCIKNTCNAKCGIDTEVIPCDLQTPELPVCEADKFLIVDEVLTRECCDDKTRFICGDCLPCDQEQCAAKFPKIYENMVNGMPHIQCKPCEKKKFIYEGCSKNAKDVGECGCIQEVQCVADDTYEPIRQNCLSKCQDESLTVIDGCPAYECIEKEVSCPDCFNLLQDGVDAEGCPNYTCQKHKETCPAGLIKKTVSDKKDKCTTIECCQPCSDRAPIECDACSVSESYVAEDGCLSWTCKPNCPVIVEEPNCPECVIAIDAKDQCGCPIKVCGACDPQCAVNDLECATSGLCTEEYEVEYLVEGQALTCNRQRCACCEAAQIACAGRTYPAEVTNAVTHQQSGEEFTCKSWECRCLESEAPTCSEDKEISSSVDADGCSIHECICKTPEEVTCELPKTKTTLMTENNCPYYECQCNCETPHPCPLGHFPEDTTDETCGCTIRTCIEKCTDKKGCGIELDRHDYIEFETGWISTEKIELKRCGGECISGDVFNILTGSYDKEFNCCSVQDYEEVVVQLTNSTSGETKDYTMKQPVACNCAVPQCNGEN